MQNEKESKPSFWSTLPGIFTALAAIITASAGLITVLYTTGVIGSKNKPPDNPPSVSSTPAESQLNNTNKPMASRDFIIGRWQVELDSGEVSAGTVTNYHADGTFTGLATNFVGGSGEKQRTSGRWKFEKLSSDTFRLTLWHDDESTWLGTFKIIDQDHVHNIDQNYVAVRIR